MSDSLYLIKGRSRSSAKYLLPLNTAELDQLTAAEALDCNVKALSNTNRRTLRVRCIFSLWTFVPVFIYRQVTVLWICCWPWNKWMSQHFSPNLVQKNENQSWPKENFLCTEPCLIKDFRFKYLVLKALMIIINLLYIYTMSWVTHGTGFIL